uniref:SUN domain-containing protein n=1 Tax=Trypanosoma congolense (strain IL3000) TaxID=1068625 RepID=G0UNE0_TRYCI|nr:conserved hypothetical protein [Trypanosoma congolense IL3000]
MKRHKVLVVLLIIVIAVKYTFLFLRHAERARRDEKPPDRNTGFTTNYASAYLGATLTDFSPTCHDASSVLNEDDEKYMLCPCSTRRKFFTVQLIRGIEVRILTLVNHEHFSSNVKNFTVLGSSKYPTNEWRVLGHFSADPRRGTQHFDVGPQQPVRFLRFLWATSHGEHSWCTLTTFKAFGVDVLETLTEDFTVSVEEEEQQREHFRHDDAPPPPPLPIREVLNMGHTRQGNEYALVDAFGGDMITDDASNADDSNVSVNTPKGHVCNYTINDAGKCGGSRNGNASKGHGQHHRGANPSIFNVDMVNQRYCSILLPPENVSGTCFPHERILYEAHMLSACMSKAVFSTKVTALAKPFTGNSVLLMLAQMSKQIKMMQQEVLEMASHQKELQSKLGHTETTMQWLQSQLMDSRRNSIELRDRLQDAMKHVEVLKSKVSLQLSMGHNCEEDTMLRVMVVGSVSCSFLSLVLSCIAARAFYRPRRRKGLLPMG